MKRSLSALAFISVLLAARAATACPTLTITSDSPSLTTLVEEVFTARSDIDTCARVRIEERARKITVTVTLEDGRTAVRTVSRREDVVGALEALLRVPEEKKAEEKREEEPAMVASPEPIVDPPVIATLSPLEASEERDVPPPVLTPRRPGVAVEVGASTGLRMGSRASYGVGAVVLLDVKSWLIGADGRLDRYTTDNPLLASRAISVSAIGGRRVRFDRVSIDLFGGGGVKVDEDRGGDTRRVDVQRVRVPGEAAAPPPPNPPSFGAPPSNDKAPMFVFGARLNFRARSVLRTFVSLDGAIGPSWSLGLSVGAAVGS